MAFWFEQRIVVHGIANTTGAAALQSNMGSGAYGVRPAGRTRCRIGKRRWCLGLSARGRCLPSLGRRPLGIAFIAAGTAVLASEYPERFEAAWEDAPEYVNRATQIFSVLSKLSERFAEQVERRHVSGWDEVGYHSRG